MQKLTIHPVTRIEGHAKVTLYLDDDGNVSRTQFHVTQVRGFEKFCVGRPYYEMPSITARICGICPVSHLLASVKACDAIMAVRIPETAGMLREVLHCGQFVQSHALSYFHLSGPDLLLGMDSDPASRNVLGLLAANPELVREGIAVRKFGQQVIERLAGERVHPAWTVPGGVDEPLAAEARAQILAELPAIRDIWRRTLDGHKGLLDRFADEAAAFGTVPTMYAGLVDPSGGLGLADGFLRFVDTDASPVADQIPPAEYARYIGEAALPDSYLKAPYFRPRGYPDGIYRVGPLARLNVATHCGTEEADRELIEFRQRLGYPVVSAFHFHYARLIEGLHALDRMRQLLEDEAIMSRRVRARAGVNALVGVGIVEAPRGILIHHYEVDENGAITKVNLIVATGHNNLAISQGVGEVAKRYVKGGRLQEGMLNRVSALVRAYDPCMSCSTHAVGIVPLLIQLVGPDGGLLDELVTG